jgi:cytochrome c6
MHRSTARRVPGAFALSLALVAAVVAACGGSDDGDAPSTAAPTATSAASAAGPAQLAVGQRVFVASCSSCHGKSGEGGRGPRLNDGRVAEDFPDLADQIALITGGKGSMPAFGSKLSAEEITAVAQYVREQL